MKRVINTNDMYLLVWDKGMNSTDFLTKVQNAFESYLTSFKFNSDTGELTLCFNNDVVNTTNVTISMGRAILSERVAINREFKPQFTITVLKSFNNYEVVK